MSVSIFTASDESFRPFLEMMLDSPGMRRADVTVIDIGLELGVTGVRDVIKLEPDFFHRYYSSFTYPGRPSAPSWLVRPLLPELTEADVIMWVDADVWFQDEAGVQDYIRGALTAEICATPEVGPILSYVRAHDGQDSWDRDMLFYYDETSLSRYPTLNGGIFASERDSPIWNTWKHNFNRALEKDGTGPFGIDQASLNYTVLNGNFTFCPLPHTYNYDARLNVSKIDGVLRTETVPFEKIHALHLMGRAKREHGRVIMRDSDCEILEIQRPLYVTELTA